MCSSALFVQLTTDLNKHICTLHSCKCLSCLLRCTRLLLHSSHLMASLHMHRRVLRDTNVWMYECVVVTAPFWLLRLVTRNKFPLMDDPYTSSLPQTLHAFNHCSRTKWASQLAGSREVQNVHISQFGKCKYIKSVVGLSSCVCCPFFMVLEIYTDLQCFWVTPVHRANKGCPCTIANSISLDPQARCST